MAAKVTSATTIHHHGSSHHGVWTGGCGRGGSGTGGLGPWTRYGSVTRPAYRAEERQ
jgi:hypothetical protein